MTKTELQDNLAFLSALKLLEQLTEKGLLGKTLAIGGMNLPLVLTAAFADADTPLDELEAELTGEAKDQIKRFDLGGDEDDDI